MHPSINLPSESIIIDWAFMHEDNILTPLSLTQQLICKSKIEKHNISLDIFVSDTNIARKLHLPGLEKKHFSYIRTHTPFLDQILVYMLLKIKEHLRIRALSLR